MTTSLIYYGMRRVHDILSFFEFWKGFLRVDSSSVVSGSDTLKGSLWRKSSLRLSSSY